MVRWFGYDDNAVVILALAETVLHTLTDHAKCRGWFGIHVDQAIHIGSKLLWWALLAGGALS